MYVKVKTQQDERQWDGRCGTRAGYPPDRGAVFVDGLDLRVFDPHAWHRSVAPMIQEALRLPSSVLENASIGGVEALGDRDGADRALAEAGVTRFASGYRMDSTRCWQPGTPDGTDVPGGQWQRWESRAPSLPSITAPVSSCSTSRHPTWTPVLSSEWYGACPGRPAV